MAYTYITNRTSPNRWIGGNTIKSIVIHHWDDPKKNPSSEGVVNWLCNPASQVSAHFVITGTGRKVWHLVNNADRAWHAGTVANTNSLGLELDPRCRNSDYDVAAEVIAELWKAYGKLPLEPHSKYTQTACPGNYDLNRLKREAEAKLNPPKPTPKPPAKKAVPSAKKLATKKRFTTLKEPTKVWDLTSYPNWKSVTAIGKGKTFEAYATIDFNNSLYYVTEYSFNKGLKNGVNAVDLKEIVPTTPPKPPVAPSTPKPEPTPDPEPVTPPKDWGKENNSLLQWIVDLLKKIFNVKE